MVATAIGNKAELVVLTRTTDALRPEDCRLSTAFQPGVLPDVCYVAIVSMRSDYDSMMHNGAATRSALEVKRSFRKHFTLQREHVFADWFITEIWNDELRIPLAH